jgi:hypothetical protein
MSPPQHQARLESLLAALRNLASRGLNVEVVLAHLHHRRIVPLMERPLCIFEMTEEADPVAVAAGPLAAGLRGYPGAARHRPQLRALQRKGPVGP